MIQANRLISPSRLLLMAIGAAMVLAIAGLVLMATGGSDSAPQIGGAGDAAPADLVRELDSLPRLPDAKDFATEIYTGGSFIDAIYFTNLTPDEVVGFFTERMRADWPQMGTARSLAAVDGKTTGGREFTATSNDVTVTVTAIATDKDPSLGKTQVSIRIERLKQ